MPTSAALRAYVDDELLRAPMLIDEVAEGAYRDAQSALPRLAAVERATTSGWMKALSDQRRAVVSAFTRSLREQVDDRPAAPAHGAQSLSLSLVEEDEVAVDVAVAHVVETIANVAEYELRELRAYLATLVGDKDVSADHNPLRPQAYGRALWMAAQALSVSRAQQASFMRRAADPLARTLRKAYAATCTRLEEAGIEPAAYRTVVVAASSRRGYSDSVALAEELDRIRETLPAPLDLGAPRGGDDFDRVLRQAELQLRRAAAQAGRTEMGRLRDGMRQQLVASAGSSLDQQLIELLSRLFDALLADPTLPADVLPLLSRLQPSTLRVALRDPRLLAEYAHPVWLFADALAFLAETLPPAPDPDRDRVMKLARGLVDHVIDQPHQDNDLYRWAHGRLGALQLHRLQQRCTQAFEQIGSLQQLEDRLLASATPPTTLAGALDVAQLDTVNAELLDGLAGGGEPTTQDASAWLSARESGEWLRCFLQGEWVRVQLLWSSDRGEVWLLGDVAGTTTWAVRRPALVALRDAHLLESLLPRSLIRVAAAQVLRRIDGGEAA
jgi:hypothetical protein